jgi:leader peptidase (prepilin peptidase)/N-methyltransferase
VIFYGLSLLLPERMWWEGLVGAAIGYGFPWLVGEIYIRVTGREGLGLGDSTLLAVVGALLGWKGVFVSLFGGALVGSVIGIVVIIRAKRNAPPESEAPAEDEASVMRMELPFGPFLCMAATFYLLAEPYLRVHFLFLGG